VEGWWLRVGCQQEMATEALKIYHTRLNLSTLPKAKKFINFRYMLNSPKHTLAKVKQARDLWSPELLLTFQLVAHIGQAWSQLQDENAQIEVFGRVRKSSHNPSDLCDLFVDA
jgi:hypothetical protein